MIRVKNGARYGNVMPYHDPSSTSPTLRARQSAAAINHRRPSPFPRRRWSSAVPSTTVSFASTSATRDAPQFPLPSLFPSARAHPPSSVQPRGSATVDPGRRRAIAVTEESPDRFHHIY